MTNNILFLPATHPHCISLQPATAAGVYSKGYKCDKCATYKISGFRMNCLPCQFDLCMGCFTDEADSDQKLKLLIHPHELGLDKSTLYTCSLCRKENSTYNWVCTQCNFYTCSTCFIAEYVKMRQTKQLNDHQHPLTLVPTRSVGTYQYGYKCDYCRLHNPTPLRWNCTPCSFDMCENCYLQKHPAILPTIPVHTASPGITTAPNPATTDTVDDDEGNLCLVCQVEPRNATFVHQGTGHTVCCLNCAKLVASTKKTCPVCRRNIDVVIQNFFG